MIYFSLKKKFFFKLIIISDTICKICNICKRNKRNKIHDEKIIKIDEKNLSNNK